LLGGLIGVPAQPIGGSFDPGDDGSFDPNGPAF